MYLSSAAYSIWYKFAKNNLQRSSQFIWDIVLLAIATSSKTWAASSGGFLLIKSHVNMISSFLNKCSAVGWFNIPLGSAVVKGYVDKSEDNERKRSYLYIWTQITLELEDSLSSLKLALVSSFSSCCMAYHPFWLFQMNLCYENWLGFDKFWITFRTRFLCF